MRQSASVTRALVLTFGLFPFIATQDARSQDASVAEKLLATIPAEYKEPARFRVASVQSSGSRVSARILPVATGWAPVFNADRTRVAYRASLGGKEFVVVGDTSGPKFDEVRALVFSPDGDTVAYAAREGKNKDAKWFIVVGEKKGPEFADVTSPVFNAHGTLVAYSAVQGERAFVVVGEKRGPEFGSASSPVWSPDGSTLAYSAGEGKGGLVVANRQGAITQVLNAAMGRQTVVIGDQRGPEHYGVTELIFSPDGKRVAYVAVERAKRGTRMCAVVDGQKGPEFDIVRALTFSPDSSKIAYAVSNGKIRLESGLLTKWGIVVDDHNERPVVVYPQTPKWSFTERHYSDVGPPTFTPDGKVAYAVFSPTSALFGRGLKYYIVVGSDVREIDTGSVARAGSPLPDLMGSTTYPIEIGDDVNQEKRLAVTADGGTFAYRSTTWNGSVMLQQTIVVGDKTSAPFDAAGPPSFSPDGMRVIFWALKGREVWRKVMDTP